MLGRQKRKVRIFIQDGPTYEGVMAGRTRDAYVLWDPRLVTADEQKPLLPVSGHLEVPRERVLYYLVIG